MSSKLKSDVCCHLVRATKVNAGLAESNGKLLLGLWRDSLHVTCGLTACTPGSAPGPTLGNEYAQKRLFMNFRCKFRHRRSIPRPRFPRRVENFGDSATFSVDFCILYLNVRHIFTSGLFDLLT